MSPAASPTMRYIVYILIIGVCFTAMAAPTNPPTEPAKKTLRILNWDTYIDFDTPTPDETIPLAQQSPTLREFAEQFNCNVEYHQFFSLEDMYARIVSMPGFYDVMVLTSTASEAMLSSGLLAPVPLKNIPNWDLLDDCSKPSGPTGEETYMTPYMSSYIGLFYRPDKIAPENRTWQFFFNPGPELQRRILFFNSPIFMLSIAMLANQDVDIEKITSEQVLAAAEKLRHLREDFSAVVDYTSPAIDRHLGGNSIWMAPLYSSDANRVLRFSPEGKYDFIIPPEGAVLDRDYLVIFKSTPNPDLAQAFINFILEPERHGRIAAFLGTEPPSVEARRIQQKLRPIPIPEALDETGCARNGLKTLYSQPSDMSSLMWDVYTP